MVSSLGHFLTGCILFRQALLMPVTWIVFLCSFRVSGLKMTKDFVSFWIYFCTGKGAWPSVIILHRDLQFAWRCLLKHMHVRVCVHTQTFIKSAAHGCVHSFLHLLFYCIYKSLCLHKTQSFFLFSFFTFLLLQLYNLLWNKVLQYFQHCFFPLRIALASWGSFVLLYEILDFFFLVLWRMWLGFDGECTESVSCFLIKLCSTVIPWAWEVKKELVKNLGNY